MGWSSEGTLTFVWSLLVLFYLLNLLRNYCCEKKFASVICICHTLALWPCRTTWEPLQFSGAWSSIFFIMDNNCFKRTERDNHTSGIYESIRQLEALNITGYLLSVISVLLTLKGCHIYVFFFFKFDLYSINVLSSTGLSHFIVIKDQCKHPIVGVLEDYNFVFLLCCGIFLIGSCKWNGIPGTYHKLMCLIRYSPDVIFLQEVIPPYYAYLKKKASSYEIITGNNFSVI